MNPKNPANPISPIKPTPCLVGAVADLGFRVERSTGLGFRGLGFGFQDLGFSPKP